MDSTIDWAALTEQKTWDRFEKAQERAQRNEGHGASPAALKIAEGCLPILMELISSKLEDLPGTLREHKNAPGLRALLVSMKELDPAVIGLCALTGVLHAVGVGWHLTQTTINLGMSLQGELFAAKLLQGEKGLKDRIEKVVRKRHARYETRRLAAKAIAKQAGYATRSWSREHLVHAGHLLVRWVLDACPHVFWLMEGKRGVKYVQIQPASLEIAMDEVRKGVLSRPAQLPCTQPPLPWTSLTSGGYPDERLKGSKKLLRHTSKAQESAARAAIRAGTMQPVLDAVNALQAVSWKINTRVLAVLTECIERKIDVKGLPRAKPYAKPAEPEGEVAAERITAWNRRCAKIDEQNRSLVTDRVLLAEDTSVAGLLESEERFWTPYNADWRGRVYPLPFFNFQRDDRVRALFLFADGAPIGDDGLYWLKVHTANCGAFDGIDKRSLKERVQWVDMRIDALENIAVDPLKHTDWMKADKPFLFLAACFELLSALATGPQYVTTLPVSWDGSCSGLQHLCAMTRAPEGELVNLTNNPIRQDVYERVATIVTQRVQADAAGSDASADVAKRCLAFGIDRSVVKRSVMTFCYASKKFGMAMQFREDLMRPLEIKVLAGELDEHPFGDDNGREAQTYLAKLVYEAICGIVTLPAEAMGFLQSCARALAHEGKALRWTTPAGLPVVNAYFEPTFARVRLWLHDASITLKLATGDTKTVAKDKAANGIAPNFVHSMDACHLMLTTNASVAEGITNIATVHDSFGCPAPQAGRFHRIIREQFITMYENNDVLAQVLETATCDLTEHNRHRLPDAVLKGSLNIQEVKDAVFAFA